MKVIRRINFPLRVILSLCIGFLCVMSVSFVGGLKVAVVDANGSPVSGAFVVYEYRGDSFGFGHPGSHTRPGSIKQTDEKGRLKIPLKILFRRPLLEYPEELVIHAVWSPKTHSNGKLWYNTRAPEKVEGVYEFIPEEKRLILYDLTSDHLMWFCTVDEMNSLTQDLLSGGLPPDLKAPYEIKRKLQVAVENDAKMFKSRFFNEVFQNPKYPGSGDGNNGKTYGRLMQPRGIL